MRQHIALTFALLLSGAAVFGQNLNPTVEVTNTYEGTLSGLVKPQQPVHLPDSLTRFNLDFDYAVFENPYKGAYEFRPYMVQLRPTAAPSTENRFYLKAGAGYSMHPIVELLWTPVASKGFRVNLYADHHSYMGYYRGISPVMDTELGGNTFSDDGSRPAGADIDTRAGVVGTYQWAGGEVGVDLSYRNLYVERKELAHRLDNGFQAEAWVRSLTGSKSAFQYDARVRYGLRGEELGRHSGAGLPDIASNVYESRIDFDGTFGPTLPIGRLLLDVDGTILRHGSYNEYYDDGSFYTGRLGVAPHLEFTAGAWLFDLGARFSTLIRPKDAGENYQHRSGFVFPEVRIDYRLLDDALVLQTSARGGDHVNGYFDLVDRHHLMLQQEAPLDNSVERIRTMIGARGRISGRFQYDLQLGYARWNGALLEAWTGAEMPYFAPAAYNHLFAELSAAWRSEHVDVNARMAYGWNDLSEDGVFAPAAFRGAARAAWHWGKRIEAGADVDWSTRREMTLSGIAYRIPGYADLGVFGDLALTRHFALWLRVSNLLNQTIQRGALYAENGIYFTAGIRLNF